MKTRVKTLRSALATSALALFLGIWAVIHGSGTTTTPANAMAAAHTAADPMASQPANPAVQAQVSSQLAVRAHTRTRAS
jgi:hypothetical protein